MAISHSDNSSLQNDPFRFKVDQSAKGAEYRNRGYRYDSLSAQLVANNDSWTPELIKKRGIKILDFILKKLDEEPNKLSEVEKIGLLGLDFLNESVPENIQSEAVDVEYQ